MSEPSSQRRNPTWRALLVYPVGAALVVMAILAWSGADMKFARDAFDFTLRRWKYGEDEPWLWLFQYGPLPMVVLGTGALLVALCGFAIPRLTRFMKPAVFIVLSILVGCGLIANVLLKDGWGRPRPSQVDGFSLLTKIPGVDYRSPFSPNIGQEGKAFPCGHATTGFCLASLAFVLWRRHRRWAIAAFTAAYAYGIVIGIARMLQGGHFASDVVAAALVCHVTQAVLYRKMRLFDEPEWSLRRRRSRLDLAVGIPLIALAIVALLVTTPYDQPLDIASETLAQTDREATRIQVEAFGNVHVTVGPSSRFHGTMSGFGVPKSRMKFALQVREGIARFFQIERGWFTELTQDLEVSLPARRGLEVELSAPDRDASWNLDLTRVAPDLGQHWLLHTDPGSQAVIHLHPDSPVIVTRIPPGSSMPVVLFTGPGNASVTIEADGPVEPELRITGGLVASK